MDQATINRHANTIAPKAASTAPTTMKTVPSGRLDLCMNGAALRSGTIRDGTEVTTPAIVGALERKPEWTTVDAAAAVVEAPVLPGVVEAADEADLIDGWVTVARFGRSVGVVCCACVVTAKRILMNTAHRRRVDTEAMIISLFLRAQKVLNEEPLVFLRKARMTRQLLTSIGFRESG